MRLRQLDGGRGLALACTLSPFHNAQVLLQDLSSKGKIGLIIKDKRNHVLKIQGILLAILAFFG